MKSASKEDFMALYSEAQKEKDRLKLQILRMENQTKNDTVDCKLIIYCYNLDEVGTTNEKYYCKAR